jgi:hypothetical protein
LSASALASRKLIGVKSDAASWLVAINGYSLHVSPCVSLYLWLRVLVRVRVLVWVRVLVRVRGLVRVRVFVRVRFTIIT